MYVERIYEGIDTDWRVLKQIDKDVERTRPELDLFRMEPVKSLLRRLLYILAIRNPASSYVQGINELCVPFIVAFLADYYDLAANELSHELSDAVLLEVEADTYWCMFALMTSVHEFFTPEMPGVQRAIEKVRILLSQVDSELASHMLREGLDPGYFAYRWISCFMMREFPLSVGMRVWDVLLSEETYAECCTYLTLAILKRSRSVLLAHSFGEMLMYLQNLSSLDWKERDVELLMAETFYLKSLYEESQKTSRASKRRATTIV